jgi:hypothetical protein
MRFYGISFMYLSKQSGQCQDVLEQAHPDIASTRLQKVCILLVLITQNLSYLQEV